MSAPQPTSSSERRVPIVTMIVVLALIGLGIGYALFGAPSDVTSETPRQAPTKVIPGELYYVFVETVEFTPRVLEEACNSDPSSTRRHDDPMRMAV